MSNVQTTVSTISYNLLQRMVFLSLALSYLVELLLHVTKSGHQGILMTLSNRLLSRTARSIAALGVLVYTDMEWQGYIVAHVVIFTLEIVLFFSAAAHRRYHSCLPKSLVSLDCSRLLL